MQKLLTAVCLFTALACTWLFVMFFGLRHDGFLWRAGITAALIAVSVATIGVLNAGWQWSGARATLGAGGAATMLTGILAFLANESAADWEGYVAIISLALVIQGALTMAAMIRKPANGQPGALAARRP